MIATPAPVVETRVHERRWWTLGVLCLSLVIIGLDNTILNVALPTIQGTFRATASELQWMVDAYVLVFAGLLLTMGALGDRFGRARTLQLGLVIFGVSSLAAPLAMEMSHIIAARVAMGVGGALIMPSTLSVIVNIFPRGERVKAITVWAGVSGLGVGLGPVIGGLLIENFAWSAVFLVNVPIVVLALVLGLVLVPDSRDPSGATLDLPGAVLSIGAVSSLVYAIIEAPAAGWTDSLILAAFGLSVVLGLAFAWRETHTAEPMLDLTLFRDARFTAGAGAIALTFFALFGVIFGLTQFLQFVLDKTALEAGAIMISLAIGIPIGARISLKAVEHAGTNRVMAAGLIVIATLLLTFTQWTPTTEAWVVSVTLFFLAIGIANVMAPGTGAVMAAVPEAKAGVGSAMNDLFRQLGGALGVAVIGSAINTVYRERVVDAVGGLPTPAAEAARDSVGAAVVIARQVGGPAGEALALAARAGFVEALGSASVVAAGVALLTAAFVLRAMPARAMEPDSTPMESGHLTTATLSDVSDEAHG